jgi:hypothetical protein
VLIPRRAKVVGSGGGSRLTAAGYVVQSTALTVETNGEVINELHEVLTGAKEGTDSIVELLRRLPEALDNIDRIHDLLSDRFAPTQRRFDP